MDLNLSFTEDNLGNNKNNNKSSLENKTTNILNQLELKFLILKFFFNFKIILLITRLN